MKIDLGEHWSIVANHYGNPRLMKYARKTKVGNWYGNPIYYFSTYGQAVKCYIKIPAKILMQRLLKSLGLSLMTS